MDYFSIFAVSFAIAFSGAMAPGPLLAAVISGSLKRGFKTGPLIISGHAFLEVFMVAVLVLGLGRFINTPEVIRTISVIGAVILMYFGVNMLRIIPATNMDNLSTFRGISSNMFLQGITLSIANPYWAVWWITIGLGLLLSANQKGLLGLVFFFTGHILADLVWYSFVSFSLSRGKRFVSPRVYRIVLKVCAFIVISFGLYFGINAFI
jgi:threonine/homoserine/homoserine lactone efflux protein